MELRANWMVLLLTAVLAGPIGCGDDADDDTGPDEGKGKAGASADKADAAAGDDDELEVAGEWTSEFGDQEISLDDWDGAKVVDFDNDENVAYTQYPEDDEFSPGKFSKLIWTEPTDEGFYYCTVDFGLDSLKDAKASDKEADDSDPESGGCGMFPWTKLEPK